MLCHTSLLRKYRESTVKLSTRPLILSGLIVSEGIYQIRSPGVGKPIGIKNVGGVANGRARNWAVTLLVT